VKFTLAAAATMLALTGPAMAQERPELVVYTYDSFASDWGPGPVIEPAFEALCACDLRLLPAGDGAAMLTRLRLEGENTEADVALGLDTAIAGDALASGLFAPHGLMIPGLDLPVAFSDPVFVPFDWGYFAFVHDKTRLPDPPASFAELRAAPSELKIVIQDPRSSTPGLGLVFWVRKVFGDQAPEVWRDLAPHVLTVTAGWTEAYGMFLAGEADMVLSYTTSPAYHLNAEQDDSKAAAIFSDGHYMQIELAARLAASDQPELARQFLEFLLSDDVQAAIPLSNWMYPVRQGPGGLPEGFARPPVTPLLFGIAEAAALRGPAIAEWSGALSR
jgi:thiamine transport system substrate-binding protein